MRKQHKKSLSLTGETLRTLGHVELERVFAGFGNATSKTAYGNSCGGCQDTEGGGGGGGGGHDQM